jgi:uncharacterized protein (TIGR03000 family)
LFHRNRGHGCNGCNGGCYGGAACSGGCSGAVIVAPAGPPAGGPPPKAKEMPPPKKATEAGLAAPATIIVSLPADATLKVDDYATTSTSATRQFVSPNLTPGQDYSYTLTGELARDGKSVVATKRITVRAGEETRVSLDFPTASIAAR